MFFSKFFRNTFARREECKSRIASKLDYIKLGLEAMRRYEPKEFNFIPRGGDQLIEENRMVLDLIKLLYKDLRDAGPNITSSFDVYYRVMGDDCETVHSSPLFRASVFRRIAWINTSVSGIFLKIEDPQLVTKISQTLLRIISRASPDFTKRVEQLLFANDPIYLLNAFKMGIQQEDDKVPEPFVHFHLYVQDNNGPYFGSIVDWEEGSGVDLGVAIHRTKPWWIDLRMPNTGKWGSATITPQQLGQPVAFCWPWVQEEYYKKWGITE